MRRVLAAALVLGASACAGATPAQSPSPDATSPEPPVTAVGLECLPDDEVLAASAEVGGPGLPTRRAAAASAFSSLALDFGGLDGDADGLVWRRDGRVVARARVIAAQGGGWYGVGADACGELQATR